MNLRWFVPSVAATMVAAICGCGASDRDVPDSPSKGKSNGNVATDDSQSRVQAELKKLTGKWTVLAMRASGIPTPAAGWFRFSFDGDRMTTETSEAGPMTVKFRLDPTTDPKTLDTSTTVDGAEEVSPGIYSLDGDVLRLSWRVVQRGRLISPARMGTTRSCSCSSERQSDRHDLAAYSSAYSSTHMSIMLANVSGSASVSR